MEKLTKNELKQVIYVLGEEIDQTNSKEVEKMYNEIIRKLKTYEVEE